MGRQEPKNEAGVICNGIINSSIIPRLRRILYAQYGPPSNRARSHNIGIGMGRCPKATGRSVHKFLRQQGYYSIHHPCSLAVALQSEYRYSANSGSGDTYGPLCQGWVCMQILECYSSMVLYLPESRGSKSRTSLATYLYSTVLYYGKRAFQ